MSSDCSAPSAHARFVHAIGVKQELITALEREGSLTILGYLEGAKEHPTLFVEPFPFALAAMA